MFQFQYGAIKSFPQYGAIKSQRQNTSKVFTECFNSNMVRLKVKERFQFQYGAIKSHVDTVCFNSNMVRLKETNVNQEIPIWCD